MLQPQHITEYFINAYIKPGDIAVDATAGNGHDTQKLCQAVGERGKVYAFDIQQCAIDSTAERLAQNGYTAELILDSHSDMDRYIKEEVKAVVFNLGYLPGGDHGLQTKADTTIEAIEKALALISADGFVAISIYYGKNSGTGEKEAVMEYIQNIDHKAYTALKFDFSNRPNNPPITVVITRNI